jgi:hypothetical protein
VTTLLLNCNLFHSCRECTRNAMNTKQQSDHATYECVNSPTVIYRSLNLALVKMQTPKAGMLIDSCCDFRSSISYIHMHVQRALSVSQQAFTQCVQIVRKLVHPALLRKCYSTTVSKYCVKLALDFNCLGDALLALNTV